MGWNNHVRPDPHEAFDEYLSYLDSDIDERPLAVRIDDYPAHEWLERELAGDRTRLPEEVVAHLGALTGTDATGWSYTHAAHYLAEWCRQQQEAFEREDEVTDA
jgi:hypothetical protein